MNLDVPDFIGPAPCFRAQRGPHVLSMHEPACPFCGYVPPPREPHPAEPWIIRGELENGRIWRRHDGVRFVYGPAFLMGRNVYRLDKSEGGRRDTTMVPGGSREILAELGGYGMAALDLPKKFWPRCVQPYTRFFYQGPVWRHIETSSSWNAHNPEHGARDVAYRAHNLRHGVPVVVQLEDAWGDWHAFTFKPRIELSGGDRFPGDPSSVLAL